MQQPDGFSVRRWLAELPLFLLAMGAASTAMVLPAFYAFYIGESSIARPFMYTAILGLILFALIGTAMAGRVARHGALGPLMSLTCVMVVLPLALALPFYEALRTTTFFNAYMEMVSAITTTGATMFDDPTRLEKPLHLWRAQVAWMGGFVMWAAAAAVLAPLNLGGFEVTARAEPGRAAVSSNMLGAALKPNMRLFRAVQVLAPIYVGLTLLLWILLFVAGEDAFVAICHAMSVMATSGISPVGGIENANAGLTGEVVMALFMIFAISRLTFSTDTVTQAGTNILTDPEIRLAIILIIVVPALLFLRHWAASFEVDQQEDLASGLRALWGAIFTVTSFLTTTGFASAEWSTAQDWSGLGTPGLILMGLALVGGGVATTAGGIKLLRVFALYRHGANELAQLIHPSSVSGARGLGRRLQSQGAYIAWVFFMLFVLSLATSNLLLAAFGVGFDEAMVLSVAGLSNTGPLLDAALADPIRLIDLSVSAKCVFAFAMVVGRLETLAIIALLTPDLWRT